MNGFFEYDEPTLFHNLDFLEWIVPFTIVYTLIMFIIIYKNKLKDSEVIDKTIRYIFGSILGVLFILNYLLIWFNNSGIDVNYLPLHLSSISMFLAIILVFTKNKPIYYFVLFTGIICGISNMLSNSVGYSYQYFKYFQFMITNGLIIIVPIYFLIVYEYRPTFKITLKIILSMQIIVLLMLLFNWIFDTSYMYLTIGYNENNKLETTLGGWPWYLIYLELIGIGLILIIYGLSYLLFFKRSTLPKELINSNSIYMSKKKESRFRK